jgi:hypothetical protein
VLKIDKQSKLQRREKMKKALTIMAGMFALNFGIAYAGGGLDNGVTDFSGKSHAALSRLL